MKNQWNCIGSIRQVSRMKPIDLVELRSQIKSGMLRPFVNRGRVYLEDTASGEVIIICELKVGEQNG